LAAFEIGGSLVERPELMLSGRNTQLNERQESRILRSKADRLQSTTRTDANT